MTEDDENTLNAILLWALIRRAGGSVEVSVDELKIFAESTPHLQVSVANTTCPPAALRCRAAYQPPLFGRPAMPPRRPSSHA
jgi:hypothetical protein